MKIKDIEIIFKWLNSGWTIREISDYLLADPEIIELIDMIRKSKVNTKIYA